MWLVVVSMYAWRERPFSHADFRHIAYGVSCLTTPGDNVSLSDMSTALEATFPDLTEELKAMPEGERPRNCQPFLDLLKEKYPDKMIEFEATYDRLVNKRVTSYWTKIVVAWLMPSIAAYVVGLSVAWVVRGFRRNREV
jgi:hypothetical protein